MDLVVLAAGLGSRFGGQKQVEPVDEHENFLIDYSIYDTIEAGFDRVVFVVKKDNFEVIKNTVGKRVQSKIKTEYVFQDNKKIEEEFHFARGRIKPLGTGHAVLQLAGVTNGVFAIINADDFYGRNAYVECARFARTNGGGSDFAMVGYAAGDTLSTEGSVKRGVCREENGFLKKIEECEIESAPNGKLSARVLGTDRKFFIEKRSPVSMNMFVFNPNVFEILREQFVEFENELRASPMDAEFYVPVAINNAIQAGQARVKILNADEEWIGMTYKKDLDSVKTRLAELRKQKKYPENLWE